MAPPDDYGWAYIDPQRASASADGPETSVQFRYGSIELSPGQFSGSQDFTFISNDKRDQEGVGSGSQLFLTGDLYVSGTIYADTYTIKEITSIQIDHSGSTIFGDTADDTHQLTGSFEVSGQSNFSGDVLIRTDGSSDPPNLALYSIGAAAAAAATDALKITVGTVYHNDAFTVLVPTAAGGLSANIVATVMARTSMGSTPSEKQIHWHLTGNDATKIANLKLAINGTSDDSKVKFGSSITNGATVGITGITATDGTANAETYVNLTADTAGTAGNAIAIANTVGTVLVNESALTDGSLAGGTAQSPSHAGAELDFRRYKDSSFAVDDSIGEVRFRGAESEGYHTAVNTAAVIVGEVGEGTWVDGASHPGQIYIGVTSEGDTTTTKRLVVTSTGLQVTGSLIVSGSTVLGAPGEIPPGGGSDGHLMPGLSGFTTFHNTLSGGVLGAGTELGLADVHANKVIVNDLYVSGSTTGVTINFGDESDPLPGAAPDSAIWGDGDDFSIYHNGNTILRNRAAGGHLIIKNESATSKIVLKTGTSTDATSVVVTNNANTTLWEVKGDGNSVLGTAGTEHQVIGSFSVQSLSGSGNASFAAAVDFAQDLTFNVDNDMGTVDFMIEDGEGPESALQLRKNGRVTKIGHDTPGDDQVLTWDQGSTSVVWGDGVIGISGSDEHYSSTELRTSGVLNVSGSATFGDGDDGSLVILPNGNLTALGDISGQDVTATRNAYVAGDIIHVGDTNTKISFTTDQIDFVCGGVTMMTLDETGIDAVHFFAGYGSGGGTIYSSGNLKIDGGLTVGSATALRGADDAAMNIISDKSINWFIDYDNDDSDSEFAWYNDTNTKIMTLSAAGYLQIDGGLLVGGATALRGATDAAMNIISDRSINWYIDYDNDDSDSEFAWYNHTNTKIMELTDDGDLTLEGDVSTVGSVTLNDIVHHGDPDTKISFTPDQIDFVCGGVTMLTLDETGTDAVHFFAGYGSGGGTIYSSGNLKIDGDLYIGGNDLRDSAGNTVISFDGSGHIDNDPIIQNAIAHLDIIATNGESSLRLYGKGNLMGDGDNIGAIRWYGTNSDGSAASRQTAHIRVETAEAHWEYDSAIGTMMKFGVGLYDTTTVEEVLYITGRSGYARVGIGTGLPVKILDVVDSKTTGYVARFQNTSTDNAADGIGIIIGGDGTPGVGNAFVKMIGGSTTVGFVVGDGSGGVSYLDAFTGKHPTVTADSSSSLLVGLIMSSIGEIWVRNTNTVSTGLPKVTMANTDNDKSVFGILSDTPTFDPDGGDEGWSGEWSIYDGYYKTHGVGENETALVVNSMGEGLVWVTDKNGELQTGDYICSTVVPGYGGLQDDDLLHNYTVAKCVETIDWSSVTDTIDHDGVTYKKYLVACTYNCG